MSKQPAFDRSSVFSESMRRTTRTRSSRMISSRMLASHSLGYGAPQMDADADSAKANAIITSLKQGLRKNQLPSEIYDKGLESQLNTLYKELFSTSGRARLPQNDIEFEKRARDVGETFSGIESSVDRHFLNKMADKREKKVQLTKLLSCIKSCGYEQDNEENFIANKELLLQSDYNTHYGVDLGDNDLDEESD